MDDLRLNANPATHAVECDAAWSRADIETRNGSGFVIRQGNLKGSGVYSQIADPFGFPNVLTDRNPFRLADADLERALSCVPVRYALSLRTKPTRQLSTKRWEIPNQSW